VRIEDFVPQVLPASMRSLAGGVPSAPPGTIFVLAADGGFCVPPRMFTLHFGRAKDDVHVAVGTSDPQVSRLHGLLLCDGREWWIRNTGKLPIQFPGDVMLLSGHEQPMEPGYTPPSTASPGGREWTPKAAAHIISALRERLAGGPRRGDRAGLTGRAGCPGRHTCARRTPGIARGAEPAAAPPPAVGRNRR
jgi:hypothetical protein